MIARSSIAISGPTALREGWSVSTRSSSAPLRLADLTAAAKVVVRGDPAALSGILCENGRSRREDDRLLVGSGPDAWLVLASPGGGARVVSRLEEQLAAVTGLVSVVDVTHAYVLLRLGGEDAHRTLEKVCAIDLSDRATPDGASFVSRVANLRVTVVRDDLDGERSYLLASDRSSGQFLLDALLDAGREFDIDVTGYPEKDI